VSSTGGRVKGDKRSPSGRVGALPLLEMKNLIPVSTQRLRSGLPRPIRRLLLVWCCLAFACCGSAASAPNVVLILADDLGWTDLGCFGSDFHETPHLDRLAAEGMRFTQNYSACTVCSPTRAALMTGKYPARLHITDWIPGLMPSNPKLLVPDWTKFLPVAETTIAKVFQSAGYATASIGKWHLGEGEHAPENHGFRVNIAGINAGGPPSYFAPWKIATLGEGNEGDYLTDRLGKEAARFIEAAKGQPFFLYLPHFAVHTPIQGRPDLVEKYTRKLQADPKVRHKNPVYAAMVESLDAAVGRVLSKLDQLNLASHTIVIFTSDNGGLTTRGTTTNAPLRYGKASAYEGGVRVPLIVRWPGVTPADSVDDTPVITMDLFPTLVEMAGLRLPQATSLTGVSGRDGISLVPLLRREGRLQRRDLFWHYPHHQHYQLGGAMPYGAIRSGDYKLIEFFNDMRVELYNIREDISEEHDLAPTHPKQVEQLRNRLHAWRTEVGAQMPLPNPGYDPTRPEHTPPPAGKAKAKRRTN
jgi:arylsulfatase A